MTVVRVKLAIGLTLICIGIYVAIMGVVASDTTDASFMAFAIGVLVGVVLVVGGLTLAVIGASGK